MFFDIFFYNLIRSISYSNIRSYGVPKKLFFIIVVAPSLPPLILLFLPFSVKSSFKINIGLLTIIISWTNIDSYEQIGQDSSKGKGEAKGRKTKGKKETTKKLISKLLTHSHKTKDKITDSKRFKFQNNGKETNLI